MWACSTVFSILQVRKLSCRKPKGFVQGYTLITESGFELWKSNLRMCILYTLRTGLYTILPFLLAELLLLPGNLSSFIFSFNPHNNQTYSYDYCPYFVGEGTIAQSNIFKVMLLNRKHGWDLNPGPSGSNAYF